MKYGPEKIKEICDFLRNGNNRTDTCLLADISYQTFTVWMQKLEFSEAIKKAEAEFKGRNILIIQNAAAKSWQAAAWLLERKYRSEFALKEEFGKSKEELSKQATEAAAAVLKLMEEASRNANSRRNSASNETSLVNGPASVQAQSTST